MNADEIRFPLQPLGEAPPLPSRSLPEDECQAADELPPLPLSPPPLPWPRVFPGL